MIDIRIDVEVPEEVLAALESDAHSCLAVLKESERELSVVIVSDEQMRPLNQHWRGKDKATDVLSFPQGPGPVLGDIVISIDTARVQALERSHPLATEMRVLLVHGLCHLRGHDHEEPGDALVMQEAEQVLLRHLTAAGEAVPAGLVLAASSDPAS